MKNFMSWWYRISVPVLPTNTPPERERDRYAHLTSAFLLLIIIFYIPTIPFMVFDSPGSPSSPYICLFMFLSLVSSFILGKKGWNVPSAICLVAFIFVCVTSELITNPLDPSLLPITNTLIFAILLAGALMPPIAAIIVGVVNSVTILLITQFQPHTAAYTHMVQEGFTSVTIYLPIVMQLGVAVMIYAITSNLIRTIRRADRAEEIVSLQQEMAEFEQDRAVQQAQLEEGFRRIAEVHARIANGDFNARVSLAEGNVLWSVAVPLNNLLNRLQDWKQQAQDHAHTRRAAQYIAEQLHMMVRSHKSGKLPPTGTVLDPIVFEINQVVQQTLPSNTDFQRK